jgi:hypothetical protein
VYVTNQPVDLAHLGGPSSYKTLSIFLKDLGTSKVSVNSGSYTLNPEEHTSTPRPAPSLNITTPTTASTPPPSSVTVTPAPVQPTASLTRSGTGPLVGVISLIGCVCLHSYLKARP